MKKLQKLQNINIKSIAFAVPFLYNDHVDREIDKEGNLMKSYSEVNNDVLAKFLVEHKDHKISSISPNEISEHHYKVFIRSFLKDERFKEYSSMIEIKYDDNYNVIEYKELIHKEK